MFQLLVVQQNLWNLICVDMIAGANSGWCGETTSYGDVQMPVMSANGKVCHSIFYNPLYGTTNIFLLLYHDLSEPIPSWYYSWYWYFEKTAWVDALLWIFLVVPITVFTYWLYEPMWIERYRIQFYEYLVEKLFRTKDDKLEKDSEVEDDVEQPLERIHSLHV